ncbi:MAG: 50S ribosomal protein L23 [Candidatus Woykebacteria bacterium RBG_13_40_15]|uniref:Large ribosomal subunit protein uL23 n=1 Tax=Candidatus Woykebacteria bacterium RBG_13_40_15 TaxID=1802593 RepID=A0A1G1W920_9BACT|nr:MAG: 50S ribosomal protein L23 [Candidatus Woykebacteria bacterium RBG_13_40_15]
MEINRVIKKPLLSEKSFQDAASGKFSFVVDLKANKKEIGKAVGKNFKVDVLSVATRISKGKRVKLRGRNQERKGSKVKIATVRLGKDQKIQIFEGG